MRLAPPFLIFALHGLIRTAAGDLVYGASLPADVKEKLRPPASSLPLLQKRKGGPASVLIKKSDRSQRPR
jgi:hypothetical protein